LPMEYVYDSPPVRIEFAAGVVCPRLIDCALTMLGARAIVRHVVKYVSNRLVIFWAF